MLNEPCLIAPAPTIELSRPVIPPRSRLYCLPPIGVGTALVESLSGYAARLAQAHCVRTGTLLRWVAEFLPEGTSKRLPADLNASSEATDRWRLTLERLTARTDLHYLTLLIWHDVVAPGGTLKASFAWCPECLRTDSVPYHRLLWALRPVTVCPTHECPLQETCPGCCHKILRLSWGSRPGHCPWCNDWLGGTGTNRCTPANCTVLPTGEHAYNLQIARVAGELLATASGLPALPTANPFGHALRAATCRDGIYRGPNAVSICHVLEIDAATIHNWTSLRAKPTLASLLNFCVKLNACVPRLLIEGKLVCDAEWSPIRHVRRGTVRETRKRKVIGPEVERALRGIAQGTSSPPPSLAQTCRALGLSSHALRRRFPQLCLQITAQFDRYKRAKAKARLEKLTAEIRRAVECIHAEGQVPSTSRVCRLLGNPNLLRKEGPRAAFFEARRKLGLDGE
jgi:hypothetical protein